MIKKLSYGISLPSSESWLQHLQDPDGHIIATLPLGLHLQYQNNDNFIG